MINGVSDSKLCNQLGANENDVRIICLLKECNVVDRCRNLYPTPVVLRNIGNAASCRCKYWIKAFGRIEFFSLYLPTKFKCGNTASYRVTTSNILLIKMRV